MKRSFAKKEPVIIFDQLLKIKKKVKSICVTNGIVFLCFLSFKEKEKEKKKENSYKGLLALRIEYEIMFVFQII